MHADAPCDGAAPVAGPPLSAWTRRQDKLLEMLVWRWRLNTPWDRVAALLGGKTPAEAFDRYARLADELRRLVDVQPVCDTQEEAAVAAAPTNGDAGMTMVPAAAAAPTDEEAAEIAAATGVGAAAGQASTSGAKARGYRLKLKPRKPCRKVGGVRRKAVMWSIQEHSQFLQGLEKYGKGKWKTLAREFVKTRSSIQIASHHQKFCNRKNKRKLNECKRASIHDITDPARHACS